ncbi:hypothetical protein CesoFtcFv8_021435 [Champsocephalus esox]|uniref:Uncharacterized protein n=2 Tax=Champsocephalus TaxID=52236 RepID=A0AAN8CV12_CHAGU|nr:hypothetical protein CesoFtcFv8_021435 [Champsocephalus esox]KAK5908940.1 hypothetical protein CgunFtcFv8_016956 [Champsocephalus gunnari]
MNPLKDPEIKHFTSAHFVLSEPPELWMPGPGRRLLHGGSSGSVWSDERSRKHGTGRAEICPSPPSSSSARRWAWSSEQQQGN